MVETKAPPQNTLTVTDNRTGKQITIPITHNSIPATAFKQLSLPTCPANEPVEDDHRSGLRILDPAYLNTAAITSSITYIDGDAGHLRHRGYPIEQLATHSTYLETAYLLIYGRLPSRAQLRLWEWEVMHHTFLAEDLHRLIGTMRYDSHPMSVFISSFAAMGAFAPEANPALQGRNLYIEDKVTMNKNIIRIIGKAATVAAASMRLRMNRKVIAPRAELSYTENMLYMMDAMSEGEGYTPNKTLAKALDMLFILHADHEMNCSTATMTHVGSSLVDPYSAIAASAAALYGPLHGGANEAVIHMLTRIGSISAIPQFLHNVKQKKDLLFGFGHRIYRNTDPRSLQIHAIAQTVFATLASTSSAPPDPLIAIAIALKDAALADPWFVQRKLYPNVDYWSGLIYKAMGFPTDFFPVLFAVPRVAGWLAHWKQMVDQSGGVKIWRPRQVYVGEGVREYVPMDRREEEQEVKDPKVGVTELPHYLSRRRVVAKL